MFTNLSAQYASRLSNHHASVVPFAAYFNDVLSIRSGRIHSLLFVPILVINLLFNALRPNGDASPSTPLRRLGFRPPTHEGYA
jgi:hypothetical protein